MTRLVDVMPVLLIIFITIAVIKHAVNVELPRASKRGLRCAGSNRWGR